jgi:poly-gamma-glutamate synthesis protein (capsule biosynthesis protein)
MTGPEYKLSTAVTAKLTAVGDIMLGDGPYCDGFGVGSQIERHGPDFPFERCRDALSDGDLLFGNLEVVISAFDRRRFRFDQTIFRAQPKAIEGLRQAGFDILSLATNHIMQHGQKALEECLQALDRAGIGSTGVQVAALGVQNLRIIEKNGLKLAFLGYNQRPQQYFLDPPSWVPGDPDRILADIARAKAQADLVVVSLHWGHEFIDYPSAAQVELGHRIVDAGAGLVLGHHPHVLQGIERYHGGLIAYSLGNFVFDMPLASSRPTMILNCVLKADEPIDFEIIPCRINDRWQPVILTGKEADRARVEIDRLGNKISVDTNDPAYRTELRGLEEAYRKSVNRWYLTHLLRYRPGRLFANFGGAIARRIIPGRRRHKGRTATTDKSDEPGRA